MKRVIVLVVGLVGCTWDVTPQARKWADDMGYEGSKISCQSMDNDNNGKVSCDVRTPKGDLLAIDCSYLLTAECTQRKMVVPAQGAE